MTKEKFHLVDGIQQSIVGKQRELEGFFAQQLSDAERQACERAHLATCGDRLFVGCNPCCPDDIALRREPATRAMVTPPSSSRQPEGAGTPAR